MYATIQKTDAKKLLGKPIYAIKKDGTLVTGKLVRIKGDRLILAAPKGKAQTKAVIPLVLFDLLAIGTSPYAYGGFGYPYGGFGGFGGFGYPGLFW